MTTEAGVGRDATRVQAGANGWRPCGQGGAVGAWEASRLARHNRAGPHLIDGCAWTETWRSDAEGLEEPRQLHARFVGGRKGALAAEAWGRLRQRARHACEATIPRGQVLWAVPVGGVRTRDERLAKSAARPGQPASAGVCQPCRALGRARQTRLWSREAQRPLPEGGPGTLGRARRWRWPSAPRRHPRRRHPSSAGALGAGRPEAQTGLVDGRARQSPRRHKPVAQWRLRRLDKHAGALDWADFLHPPPLLAAQRPRPQDGAGGAGQRGPACLRGGLRWGRCGRPLPVASRGTTGGGPRSGWRGGRVERGAAACWPMGGRRGARAVEAVVVEARHPAGLHAAWEARAPRVAQQDIPRPARAWALEKARDAAQRARRPEALAAPATRGVAGAWDQRWHEARPRGQDAAAHRAALEQRHGPRRAEPSQPGRPRGQARARGGSRRRPQRRANNAASAPSGMTW